MNEIAWKDGMGVPPASNGINMSHPGAALYIKTVVEQLQGWGVKFIKLDFGPSELEVKAYADAINATGSGIILSVNSGQGHDYCNMYVPVSAPMHTHGQAGQELGVKSRPPPTPPYHHHTHTHTKVCWELMHTANN